MTRKRMPAAILDRTLRLVAAVILGSALGGKFNADPGAVMMFSELGVEPFGRIATGAFEALAVLLLLLPATVVFGSLLTLGLMTGALLAHLTVLGPAPAGDPSLLARAAVAAVCAAALAWLRRGQIPLLHRYPTAAPAKAEVRRGPVGG